MDSVNIHVPQRFFFIRYVAPSPSLNFAGALWFMQLKYHDSSFPRSVIVASSYDILARVSLTSHEEIGRVGR